MIDFITKAFVKVCETNNLIINLTSNSYTLVRLYFYIFFTLFYIWYFFIFDTTRILVVNLKCIKLYVSKVYIQNFSNLLMKLFDMKIQVNFEYFKNIYYRNKHVNLTNFYHFLCNLHKIAIHIISYNIIIIIIVYFIKNYI